MPRRCVATYSTSPWILDQFSDRPVEIITHELKQIEFVRKDAMFSLNYSAPGTFIIDRTTPEARAKPDHRLSYMIPGG